MSIGTEPMKAPGQSVEESNRNMLSAVERHCEGVSRWNAFDAPVPHGTSRLHQRLLGKHKFFSTTDKNILYSASSWDWGCPTWLISGVSCHWNNRAFRKL